MSFPIDVLHIPLHMEGGGVFAGAGWHGVPDVVVEGVVCAVPDAGALPGLVLAVAEEA